MKSKRYIKDEFGRLPLRLMKPHRQVQHHFCLILDCEAIGTAATPGLLCQPRVIVKMIVEKQMECRFAGETEVLGENLPQCHFCPSQNATWPDPGLNPGRSGGKPATNRLSYGAAFHLHHLCILNEQIRFRSVTIYILGCRFNCQIFRSRTPSTYILQIL
jgi:hypothetical protein